MTLDQVKTYLQTLSTDLSQAESKQDQLEYIVELGKQLVKDASLTTEPELKVPGCASNNYVLLTKDNPWLQMSCYTDSYVVAGYLVIIEKCLDGLAVKDFAEVMNLLTQFAESNDLHTSHIPSRADAFNRICGFIEKQFIQ